MSSGDIMFVGWDRIIHKYARSRDNKEIGSIVAVDDDGVVLNQGNVEFRIPKSYVEGYKENSVFLGLNGKDIQYYQLTELP